LFQSADERLAERESKKALTAAEKIIKKQIKADQKAIEKEIKEEIKEANNVYTGLLIKFNSGPPIGVGVTIFI